GEEYADVDLDSPWGKVVKAVLAEVTILAGRLAPDHAEELAAHASERVPTQLAAGVAREAAKDALAFLERVITVDKQSVPIDWLRHLPVLPTRHPNRSALDFGHTSTTESWKHRAPWK